MINFSYNNPFFIKNLIAVSLFTLSFSFISNVSALTDKLYFLFNSALFMLVYMLYKVLPIIFQII